MVRASSAPIEFFGRVYSQMCSSGLSSRNIGCEWRGCNMIHLYIELHTILFVLKLDKLFHVCKCTVPNRWRGNTADTTYVTENYLLWSLLMPLKHSTKQIPFTYEYKYGVGMLSGTVWRNQKPSNYAQCRCSIEINSHAPSPLRVWDNIMDCDCHRSCCSFADRDDLHRCPV